MKKKMRMVNLSTYDFPSGVGNMEGDPLVMTEWKVNSPCHAVICMQQQGKACTPQEAKEETSKMIYSPWPLELAS